MALATAAAVAASGSAAAAYLNAKYHLHKDLTAIIRVKLIERYYAQAAKKGRTSLWLLFAANVQRYPDATCIWTREKEWTWKEIQDATAKYARFFLSQGVQPGDLVSFYLMNGAEFMIAWLALFQIGCAPAMVNYNLEDTALVHCLKVADSKLVFADNDKSCRERIEKSRTVIEKDLGMKIVYLDARFKDSISDFSTEVLGDELRKNVTGKSPAAIFYTSGTTGLPKGCPYLQERQWLAGPHIFTHFGTVPGPGGDRWYNPMPLYHGTGGITSMSILFMGASLAVAPRFSVSGFWKDIHDSGSTMAIYVGETIRYLLNAPPSPYDRDHKLRCVFGNGLRPDVWERFKDRFNVPEVAEFFNSTEGVLAFVNWNKGPFTSACVGHHGAILRQIFKNIYVPVRIDYETGDIWRDPKTGFAQRPDYSEGGEMLVALPNKEAFQGYWRNNDATEKKFASNVFRKGDLFYRSGDALRRSPDGKWYFMDRLGDTYRWKSENVATAEVSEILGRYPGVADANVYGVLVPNHDGRAGCAAIFVNEAEKATFDYDGLLRFARARLPQYAVPVFLRVVSTSSATHNNKQNKVPLRNEGVDPERIGVEVLDGKEDKILWIPPKGNKYVEFTENSWKQLQSGQAML
ncbi:MAG: hypothetical protein Q9227_007166 [Pyrenula ochraceoflavens]